MAACGHQLDYPYLLVPMFPLGFQWYKDHPVYYGRDWERANKLVVQLQSDIGGGWPEARWICGTNNQYYVAVCTSCAKRKGLLW